MADEIPEETPVEPTEPAPDAVAEPPEASAPEAANTEPESVPESGEETVPAETGEESSAAEETAPPEEQPAAEPAEAAAEATEAPAAEAAKPPVAEATEAPAAEATASEAPAADDGEAAATELTLGEGAPAEVIAEEKVVPVIRGKIDRFGVAMGTGRRKTSVARVRVRPGDGKLTINGRALDEHFSIERDRLLVEGPLRATGSYGEVDVWVRVDGGGTTGQAGAIVLGIARALQAMNPDLHHALSGGGYLTRDSRMVERKKYGYKKARKSFQFSKR